jgi:predicted nucleic acid-binding protein
MAGDKAVYLDTCCYSRPFDNRSQAKIAAEARAIKVAVNMCKIAGYPIIGSEAVEFELGRIKDGKKRKEIERFYRGTICYSAAFFEQSIERANELMAEGLGNMDSRHLAIAENEGARILLTADEDFVRICANKDLSFVKVVNPVIFLTEISKWA